MSSSELKAEEAEKEPASSNEMNVTSDEMTKDDVVDDTGKDVGTELKSEEPLVTIGLTPVKKEKEEDFIGSVLQESPALMSARASTKVHEDEEKKNHYITKKYPRMMDPEAHHNDDSLRYIPTSNEGPGPRWLRPEGATAEVMTDKASKFNEAFKPITELSTEDVICGCTVKGAEMVKESREHLGKFRSAIRQADTISALEAGQICELPVAATKAVVGVTFYSAAAGARFAPKAIALAKRKALEWQVADKAMVATHYIKNKTIDSVKLTTKGIKITFSWLKHKALAFYGFDQPPTSIHDSVDDEADAQV